MRLLYDVAIALLTGLLHGAAWFHPKAKKWVAGRQNWRNDVSSRFAKRGAVLWVHVSSLGEFEQGRPVIEAFRVTFPDWQIVLTFFSPSGYEVRKNYPHADLVCYLPADTRRNARDFLDLVRPDAALFVKYDFWANYLFEVKKCGIPTVLVSALFRPKQPFFRWYGGLWRRMLGCFTHIFVQNELSAALLHSIGFQNITVAGDTRVDRVLSLATPP
ncbi:MAG: glycosyltransferase N-terminal domain-containing protein, partial [Saprospiraceae bacterium]